MKKRKDRGIPYDPTPMGNAFFGSPEDCFALINRYGTYNIQPTADADSLFPMIAHGMPEAWEDFAVGKEKLEEQPPEETRKP